LAGAFLVIWLGSTPLVARWLCHGALLGDDTSTFERRYFFISAWMRAAASVAKSQLGNQALWIGWG